MPPATDPDRLAALADRCVRCGLCLPHCPTYRLDRNEAESPRGRIALARGLAAAALPATPALDLHLDHCLGCRRCEQVCPAGVEYGALLVAARALQRRRRGAASRPRLIEALCARPAWLERLLGVYRHAFRLVPARWRPLGRPPPAARPGWDRNAETAVFLGCIGRRYELPAAAALLALCRAAGVPLACPSAQTCCGALHAHAGADARAGALAQHNRRAFAGHATVLTLASGCHEAVAAALPATQDALVFLAARSERLRFRPAVGRVALHLPCTQRGLPGSVAALHTLLAAVPDLDLIELPDTGCCGAAGSHMLDFPDRAGALRRPLIEALRRSGAATLLSANLGCRLHLDRGTAVTVMHPLEFLAEHLQ